MYSFIIAYKHRCNSERQPPAAPSLHIVLHLRQRCLLHVHRPDVDPHRQQLGNNQQRSCCSSHWPPGLLQMTIIYTSSRSWARQYPPVNSKTTSLTLASGPTP
ncbi:hypothetical protein Q8A73_021535 [Channa argus]|nr:hypothetical protein Q8A73_021535 [Channa argus]